MMKQLHKPRVIFLCILGIFTLSGTHLSLAGKEPEPVILQITLNQISPGLITLEQLLSVKRIRVFTADGNGKEKEYKINFCRIALLPVSGKSSKIDIESSDIDHHVYDIFGDAKPGDLLLIGNLKLEGLTNFKFIIPPSWTITARKKQ